MERAGLLGGVTLRSLKPDNKRRLRGDILQEAIDEDIRNGLIPFYVSIQLFIFLRVYYLTRHCLFNFGTNMTNTSFSRNFRKL